jgi:splicing factor 3B subunit 1
VSAVLLLLVSLSSIDSYQSLITRIFVAAIVAETCGPFTCIPAILNEYRTAELNVRTGCLKALSFVFEYVGPQSAFYCDSVVTMLEDALTDRDLVHRQTASTIVKHLALGVAGLGCEDSMLHLMNLVWPNCFETSPHVIGAVMDAIEAMRVALGPGVLLSYVLQGLFHPARKVREASLFLHPCISRLTDFAVFSGLLANLQRPLPGRRRCLGAILSRPWRVE